MPIVAHPEDEITSIPVDDFDTIPDWPEACAECGEAFIPGSGYAGLCDRCARCELGEVA